MHETRCETRCAGLDMLDRAIDQFHEVKGMQVNL